jgi:hypothetical protein
MGVKFASPEIERPVLDVQEPGVGVELIRRDRNPRLALGQVDHGRDPIAALGPNRIPDVSRIEVGPGRNRVVKTCHGLLGAALHLARLVLAPMGAVPHEPVAGLAVVPEGMAMLLGKPTRVSHVGQKGRIFSGWSGGQNPGPGVGDIHPTGQRSGFFRLNKCLCHRRPPRSDWPSDKEELRENTAAVCRSG